VNRWYGTFFLVAAASQLGLAGCPLTRPTRAVVRAGVVGSVLAVALWLVTRTIGIPVGPDRGTAEPLGLLDGISTLAEICVAVLGVLALRRWSASRMWRRTSWRAALRGD
jgi:hypothetical protein